MDAIHGPLNSYNSNINDHWSQIITNIIIIKKLEILWELPKCDTETQSEQMLMEKMESTDTLNAGLPQTFNL